MNFPLRTAWISCVALVIAGTVIAPNADAQVYKYRDPATGKTIMTDNPPAGAARQRPSAKRNNDATGEAEAPGDGTAPQKTSGIDPRLEERKREEEAKARAEQEAANAKLEEQKRQYCADLDRNIATLESGQRIAQMNAAGEREFMTDEKRSAEISRMRAEQAKCE